MLYLLLRSFLIFFFEFFLFSLDKHHKLWCFQTQLQGRMLHHFASSKIKFCQWLYRIWKLKLFLNNCWVRFKILLCFSWSTLPNSQPNFQKSKWFASEIRCQLSLDETYWIPHWWLRVRLSGSWKYIGVLLCRKCTQPLDCRLLIQWKSKFLKEKLLKRICCAKLMNVYWVKSEFQKRLLPFQCVQGQSLRGACDVLVKQAPLELSHSWRNHLCFVHIYDAIARLWKEN